MGNLSVSRTGALTAIIAVATLLIAGCASSAPGAGPGAPGAAPAGIPTPTATILDGNGYGSGPVGPGAFVVRTTDTELRVDPVTYCWGSGCVDGVEQDPSSIGTSDELFVRVPVAEFDQLYVSRRSDPDWCATRTMPAEVVPLGDGWFRVVAAGPADDYLVDLFASGDGSGDMAATIAWTTASDHPLPAPIASLALVVDHDGRPDSYGLELSVANLSASPNSATATITTTAANGRSLTFDATLATEGCVGVGALYFDGPDDKAREAAALGDFPFRYDVTLTLDGETYTATAITPDDLSEPGGVSVTLAFTPALP